MHKVISEAMAAGRSLFESEAWELFSAYGLRMPRAFRWLETSTHGERAMKNPVK